MYSLDSNGKEENGRVGVLLGDVDNYWLDTFATTTSFGMRALSLWLFTWLTKILSS